MNEVRSPTSAAPVAAPARSCSRATSIRSTIGGLGVGGIGVSTIDAKGEVYNLAQCIALSRRLRQGRYGAVAGTASLGDLWLENPNGVVMHLKAKREGLMLSSAAMPSSSP